MKRFLLSVAFLFFAYGSANAQTKIRFSLDWKFEGQTSFFHMAKAKGYFDKEGLDVGIDVGNGSAAAIQRITTGAYDIALGDLSSLIEFMSRNPEQANIQAVYLIYDEAPVAYYTLKQSGISSVSQFVGKSITGHTFEIHRKLFPLVAKMVKIDPDSMKWVTLDSALRTNAVIKGDAQITGGFMTMPIEFEVRGVRRDAINEFRISDLGIHIYGNGILASTKLIKENPRAVAGFVRAANQAFREGIADPATSVKYLKQRDPIVDEDLQLKQFRILIPTMLTDRTRVQGLGAVDMAVLGKQIDYVVETFGLKNKPAADQVFNASFLPPKTERLPLNQP